MVSNQKSIDLQFRKIKMQTTYKGGKFQSKILLTWDFQMMVKSDRITSRSYGRRYKLEKCPIHKKEILGCQ